MGGISIGTEVRGNITNAISVGLRLESALLAFEDDLGESSIGATGSFALIGDYYLNTEKTARPFVGLGIGSFAGAEVGSSTGEGDTSIGIIPRIGYEIGLLRFSAEYNYAFSSDVPDYIGIQLALTLFGGTKS